MDTRSANVVGGWEKYPTEKTILHIWPTYYVGYRQVLRNGILTNWGFSRSGHGSGPVRARGERGKSACVGATGDGQSFVVS